jgi:hypothetical protein
MDGLKIRVHLEFWKYDFCLGRLRQCWINEIDGSLRGPTETVNARAPFRDSEQLSCDPMSLDDPPVGFGLTSVSQMRWIRDKVGNYFRSFQTSVRRFLILRNCLSCCARASQREPCCRSDGLITLGPLFRAELKGWITRWSQALPTLLELKPTLGTWRAWVTSRSFSEISAVFRISRFHSRSFRF